MLMGLEEIQWFGGIHSGMLAAEFGEMIQQGNVNQNFNEVPPHTHPEV